MKPAVINRTVTGNAEDKQEETTINSLKYENPDSRDGGEVLKHRQDLYTLDLIPTTKHRPYCMTWRHVDVW